MIPGRRALRINVLKFAESRRSKKFSIQGAPDEPSVQARTVFQIVFADGTVMTCLVIDLSETGAAVSADLDPEIGTVCAVGTIVCRVIRRFVGGFAVLGRTEQLLGPGHRRGVERTEARRVDHRHAL